VLFNRGYEPGERFINPIVGFNFRAHFNRKDAFNYRGNLSSGNYATVAVCLPAFSVQR
jgi:hypothetical protein